ncbi:MULTISPECIES: STAS domain-containing protein [unclassified Streptomyces]|uniref:STAS domain-containing protein n=1 Tax=unclassified Streptomyces TaxID=2593676 RepID=UPI00381B215C
MPTPYEPPEPATVPPPPPGPRTAVWHLPPPLSPAEIPALCARLRRLLREHPYVTTVLCDVTALDAPGATAVEALLRLQLTAHRLGRGIRLRHAPETLRLLLTLTGLAEALPLEHPQEGER